MKHKSSIKDIDNRQEKRIFVATENLYLYDGADDGWCTDTPSEYGKDYGMTAKEVRDEFLGETIRKGAKFYLKDTDGDDCLDKDLFPYCLRSIRGFHVVGLVDLRDLESDPAFMEVNE